MSWFVCTIARSSARNWDLCKQVNSYGVPGRKAPRVEASDHLVFWVGGKGFVGEGVVTGPPVVPQTKDEAPWPGGLYQYGFVVPFRLVVEADGPVKLPFVGQTQEQTGISKAQLRRSVSLISDEAGAVIHEALVASV